MNSSEYDKLDRVEDRMWWFAAVHANLLMAARRCSFDKSGLPILDAGCGTGGLLTRLAREFCERPEFGLDLDSQACARAATKSTQPVCVGSVNDLPFADAAFAAIFSADVLCHEGVDEDRALRHFYRSLAPNGWLILNLPAYRWLLSGHDVAVSNIRRYTATGVRRLLKAVGFRPVYISYWNTVLLPLMVITRKLGRRAHDAASDVRLYPRSIEISCRAVMAVEAALLQHGLRLPFGGSILAIAAKEGERD